MYYFENIFTNLEKINLQGWHRSEKSGKVKFVREVWEKSYKKFYKKYWKN